MADQTSSVSFIPTPMLPLKRPLPLSASSTAPPRKVRPRLAAKSLAHDAVQTFTPAPFNPHPVTNPNLQTILANFYPRPPPAKYARIRIRTSDKESILLVDIANGTTLAPDNTPTFRDKHGIIQVPDLTSNPVHGPPSKPVAVVLHGLESNSEATITLRIVDALQSEGFKVCVLNYRSCAPGDRPTTLKLYHAAFTDDVELLLRGLRESAIAVGRHPPEIYLCGFSLGANLVCQFLGKKGSKAMRDYNVVCGAAACVPFDPKGCQRKLDTGWRGVLYSRYLVDTLQRKVRSALEAGVDTLGVDLDTVAKADRIGLIDDAYITPVFGFKDRFDYYEQADSRKVLKHITVPTLIINARDDPFFDHENGGLPTTEMLAGAPVLAHITENGGHCAFLDKPGFQEKSPCYFMREFARFFSHVRKLRQISDKERADMDNTSVVVESP